MNFQSSKLLLLYDFNSFIPALSGQLFFFGLSYNDIPKWEVFLFLETWYKFQHYFVFQSFVQSNFSRQSVALSGVFVPLE